MSIIALFDMSGHSVEPWAKAGHKCYCLDLLNKDNTKTFDSGGSITFLQWDARDPWARQAVMALAPQLILSFPPCTDLAVSGAKHFESKAKANPNYLKEALELVLLAPSLETVSCIKIPWLVENPVGVISTNWKKPDYIFNPSDFGGYLPADDVHPEWPKYIVARDAYKKATCVWHGGGMRKPKKKEVSSDYHIGNFNKQTALLGGKSLRTKIIRSLTPRGFAAAIYTENRKLVESMEK